MAAVICTKFPEVDPEMAGYTAAHFTQCILAKFYGLDYHYELTDETKELYEKCGECVR